jgi:hypothetical protein
MFRPITCSSSGHTNTQKQNYKCKYQLGQNEINPDRKWNLHFTQLYVKELGAYGTAYRVWKTSTITKTENVCCSVTEFECTQVQEAHMQFRPLSGVCNYFKPTHCRVPKTWLIVWSARHVTNRVMQRLSRPASFHDVQRSWNEQPTASGTVHDLTALHELMVTQLSFTRYTGRQVWIPNSSYSHFKIVSKFNQFWTNCETMNSTPTFMYRFHKFVFLRLYRHLTSMNFVYSSRKSCGGTFQTYLFGVKNTLSHGYMNSFPSTFHSI